MSRIRVASVRNTATFIVACCFASSQIHASFQSQRLMKVMRNKDNHNIPSIFASNGLNDSRARHRNKKRDKKHKKVQSLTKALTGSTHQLQEATYVSQADEGNDEKSSRQKNQPTTLPSSSPVISSNNKNSDGKQQKAPVSSSATFTVSPVAVPVDKNAKPSIAPLHTPTIRPVSFTLPTETPTSTPKPILSIPLDVPTSPAPTTFFVDLSTAPTTTPQIITTKSPSTQNRTVQPSPVLVITPLATPLPTIAPIVTNNITTNGKDVVLDDDQSTTGSTAVADVTTTNTHSNGKAKTGTIVGVVIGVIVSMIVSVMVLKARHKYVQKHGAASTRRRRNKSQRQEIEVAGAGIDIIDGELHNIKTVHIISNLDHDTAAEASPDRTYEIHLEDDDDDDVHVHSPESSFLSTSGGEEIGSDLDQNITTSTRNNTIETARNSNAV